MATAIQNADKVVKSEFQKPIDMHAELKSIRASNPQAAIPSNLMAAAANPTPITGLTFIPPLNANPLVASPPIPASSLMAAATVVLPEYFNWADTQAVVQEKGWPSRKTPYVSSVFDQKACGSCWYSHICATG